ncbi:GTP 3',8-cyclase MoaA [Psychroserpens luteolus]|uniref:GTP 3',8-cyclase MoaA n=1 Tax=Psychroserpens luteolus TaxID=2855840 RepID=UPI001E3EF69E|nr:GTP 3',8-cyclase MoaA [Psychroserpens luteolus]MCD2257742.1 GTP 3',8-cyclase MoaA [Psychroserpens luteolus]
MKKVNPILIDTYKREHTYLRISLTERCNLRCTYCMPAEGIQLSPKSHIMSFDEIYTIAKTFVDHGVTKIRLTGGEPLVRKDAHIILEKLATLPVELALTTNAVNLERHIETLKNCHIKNINVSLDSLNAEKFKEITRRDYFDKVYNNILSLVAEGFNVKINAVLIKGFNDNEIIDFIELTKTLPVTVRFIEFMPFDGNKWDIKKMVSLKEILGITTNSFSKEKLIRLEDAKNDTSKNYKIKGYKGSFAIISSVTNPFCDSCNRLRLTANGHLKNCLFSAEESDLLTALRAGKSIETIIEKAIRLKAKMRGGMDTLEKLKTPDLHSKNRSMITIGG